MTRNQSFYLDFGWQVLLKDMGFQPSHVLRKAGLPEDLFSREGYALTTDEYFRFWRNLEAEAGDPLFSLGMVEKVSAESFMGYVHAPEPEPSLRLTRNGIAIHKIQGVSFTYKSDPVHHEPWSEGTRHYGIR